MGLFVRLQWGNRRLPRASDRSRRITPESASADFRSGSVAVSVSILMRYFNFEFSVANGRYEFGRLDCFPEGIP